MNKRPKFNKYQKPVKRNVRDINFRGRKIGTIETFDTPVVVDSSGVIILEEAEE